MQHYMKITVWESINAEGEMEELTIVVAEDEDINFLFISEVLMLMGIKNIIQASDGYEVIDICIKNPNVSMVFMDIKMPNLDGYEATRQLKRIKPELPIVAQTAFALTDDRGKALAAGCDDYIAKPTNKELLQHMVRKYCKIKE